MTNQTFEEWLVAVDTVIINKLGLSYQDLPDCPYRAWYYGWMSPRSAAAQAIRNAKE